MQQFIYTPLRSPKVHYFLDNSFDAQVISQAKTIVNTPLAFLSHMATMRPMRNPNNRKAAQDAVTPREFAKIMGVSYPCVIRWLKRGTIPGAVKEKSPVGDYWAIPIEAIKMSKPKRGRPRKESKHAKV